MEGEGGMLMIKKAEIDTSTPFRSVKEAILLFGDRVLASEVYANKLKECIRKQMHEASSDNGHVTAELEETKESLQKAQEESMLMASCLSSLQQELERTKRELRQLKHEQESDHKQVIEPEIEDDLKFIGDLSNCQLEEAETSREKVEFQKKRYVTFANQPSLERVVVTSSDVVLERQPSIKKKKKKSLIPLISGIFSRKKGA